MKNRKIGGSQKGFTLIEILVVIGLIAILATVVLIAINPARQFAQANDSQRTANVNAILNAIGQYAADNKGDLPAGIPAEGDPAIEVGVALCNALVPDYMPGLPTDPDSATNGASITDCATAVDDAVDYTVEQDLGGRITVSSRNPEIATEISVIR